MDLSNLFPQAPSYISGLLGEDEADRLRRQAQQSGLLNIGLSLLAGAGPQPQRTGIGQLLAQGVMAGQQASRNAYEQAVKDKMMQQQIEEQQLARQEAMAARQILPTLIRQPRQEIYGEDIMGQRVGEGVNLGAPELDMASLAKLFATAPGVATKVLPSVEAFKKLTQPEEREIGGVLYQKQNGEWRPIAGKPTITPIKRGESLIVTDFTGKQTTVTAPNQQTSSATNPFTPLLQGGVIHPSIVPYANQLERSFATMDEDMLNKSMERLVQMNAQATSRQESAESTASARAIQAELTRLRIDDAKARQEQAKDGKPLPTPIMTDLLTKSESASNLISLKDKFDDKYGGFKVDALGRASITLALRSDDDEKRNFGQWWQQYDLYANQIRNQLFGATLTKAEGEAFKSAMVTPGMSPSQIRANLARQATAAKAGLEKLAAASKASGYSKSAIDALTTVGEMTLPDESAIDAEINRRKKGGQ